MKIHQLIQNMATSEKVKHYFNQLEFYKIIEDAITFSDPLHEVIDYLENRWSFSVELRYCNIDDLLAFYQEVINARKKYLIKNNIKIKMIFYTWYDPMSGNFNFSIISKNCLKSLSDHQLPFDCTVNKVDKLEDIISNFINDPYKGRIPMDEFKEIDLSEDTEDDDDTKNYILDVWSTVL